MDKQALGSLLLQLRDRDKLRLFDKVTNKEYAIMGGMRTYNEVEDRHIVDISIVEVKHDGSK
jgi:hypothetical protein|nr:MAG TPA_asm: hypothetical protein [Caudoviricetes sp.]